MELSVSAGLEVRNNLNLDLKELMVLLLREVQLHHPEKIMVLSQDKLSVKLKLGKKMNRETNKKDQLSLKLERMKILASLVELLWEHKKLRRIKMPYPRELMVEQKKLKLLAQLVHGEAHKLPLLKKLVQVLSQALVVLKLQQEPLVKLVSEEALPQLQILLQLPHQILNNNREHKQNQQRRTKMLVDGEPLKRTELKLKM